MTTAIAGLVGVIIGSILTAALNFYLQRAADRRRWQREDQKQRQLWEREDHIRFQEDRLRVYRDLTVAAYRAYKLEEFDWENMERMTGEIELISGSSNLVWAAVKLAGCSRDVWQAGHHGGNAELNASVHQWEIESAKFNKAAQAELGIPATPYQPTEQPPSVNTQPTLQDSQEGTQQRPWWQRIFGEKDFD